jgi:hypothetical protein
LRDYFFYRRLSAITVPLFWLPQRQVAGSQRLARPRPSCMVRQNLSPSREPSNRKAVRRNRLSTTNLAAPFASALIPAALATRIPRTCSRLFQRAGDRSAMCERSYLLSKPARRAHVGGSLNHTSVAEHQGIVKRNFEKQQETSYARAGAVRGENPEGRATYPTGGDVSPTRIPEDCGWIPRPCQTPVISQSSK